MGELRSVSVRLEDGLVVWLDAYAAERGSSRSVLVESAVEAFRLASLSGVPDLRERVAGRSGPAPVGVGVCAARGVESALGHVWADSAEDPSRPCLFCGVPGRGAGGFLELACRERAELFAGLMTPVSCFPAKAVRGRNGRGG